jgi:transposase
MGIVAVIFIGGSSGCECAAAIYRPIGSARRKGVDAKVDLHYVIVRLADHPVNGSDELLPGRVAPLLHAASNIDPIR